MYCEDGAIQDPPLFPKTDGKFSQQFVVSMRVQQMTIQSFFFTGIKEKKN
jgi:hypothetical protein